MAASLILLQVLPEKVKYSKILVVGAGGIGCELIKNLVMTGFNNIELVSIDLSSLKISLFFVKNRKNLLSDEELTMLIIYFRTHFSQKSRGRYSDGSIVAMLTLSRHVSHA
jgi:malic enzyme